MTAHDPADGLGEWEEFDDTGAEPTIEPGVASTPEGAADLAGGRATTTPEMVAAHAAVADAQRRLAAAEEELMVAQNALADAEGVERVAQARYDEAMTDEALAGWEKIAAEEALNKASRDRGMASAVEKRRYDVVNDAMELVELAISARAELAAQQSDPADAADGDEGEGLYFSSLSEWVEQWLVPTYRRWIGGLRTPNGEDSFWWDPEWWSHPEAVVRLEALWRAFEHLRREPALGMSVWLRDHADHHMPILLSKFGPFGATTGANQKGDPLPHTPPPAGLFTPVED